MKRFWLALLLFASLLVVPKGAEVSAQEDFKRAPATCKNAHAILGWSTYTKAEQHEKPWIKIGWILGRRKYLQKVDTPEPGKAQQASFTQYKVTSKDAKGRTIEGHAYVAHCGAGATCNEIAGAFFNIYRGLGKPAVHCGANALPKMLHGGFSPEIPIPSDEEIAEADADALEDEDDDDDLDFDDDDDDDDMDFDDDDDDDDMDF